MTRGATTSQRGVALLIVLATLILTMTAATIAVRAAVSHQIDDRINDCSALEDDLLTAAEAPIQNWLATKSSKIVRPPDVITPEVAVLHDSWMIRSEPIEMIITAWDQCGMVPLKAVENGLPLRLTLADEVLQQIPQRSLDAATTTSIAPAGLDQFITRRPEAEELLVASPFPVATRLAEPIRFGDGFAVDRSVTGDPVPNLAPRMGALVATHNAQSINVNTAPIPVVEAALRLAGRGGLEQIVTARKAGKLAAIGGQISPTAQSDQFAPQLVTASNCWAFRIDINVGPRKCSWWSVYQSVSGKRELVQRLVITH